jgi:hypothetical protein
MNFTRRHFAIFVLVLFSAFSFTVAYSLAVLPDYFGEYPVDGGEVVEDVYSGDSFFEDIGFDVVDGSEEDGADYLQNHPEEAFVYDEALKGDVVSFESDVLGVRFSYAAELFSAAVVDDVVGKVFFPLSSYCGEPSCGGLLYSNVDKAVSAYSFDSALYHMGFYEGDFASVYSYAAASDLSRSFSVVQIANGLYAQVYLGRGYSDWSLRIYDSSLQVVHTFWIDNPTGSSELRYSSKALMNMLQQSFEVFASLPEVYPEVLADGEEIVFDGCGALSDYTQNSFYDAFISALSVTPMISSPIAEARYGDDYAFDESFVRDVCVAFDSSVVVAVVSGRYCDLGHVVRYSTITGELSLADSRHVRKIIGGDCMPSFGEFGKRNGHLLDLFGYFGDAGFSASYDFVYDYTANVVGLLKSCSSHVNFDTDELEEEECREY